MRGLRDGLSQGQDKGEVGEGVPKEGCPGQGCRVAGGGQAVSRTAVVQPKPGGDEKPVGFSRRQNSEPTACPPQQPRLPLSAPCRDGCRSVDAGPLMALCVWGGGAWQGAGVVLTEEAQPSLPWRPAVPRRECRAVSPLHSHTFQNTQSQPCLPQGGSTWWYQLLSRKMSGRPQGLRRMQQAQGLVPVPLKPHAPTGVTCFDSRLRSQAWLGGGGPLQPLLPEGVSLQVLVTTPGDLGQQRTTLPPGQALPHSGGSARRVLSTPPRSRPVGLASVTGTCSGGEEHSAGPARQQHGLGGPSTPGAPAQAPSASGCEPPPHLRDR